MPRARCTRSAAFSPAISIRRRVRRARNERSLRDGHDFQHMPVGIAKIKAAAAAKIVELAVIETPGALPKGMLAFLMRSKIAVELAVADIESQMVAFERALVVEQKRQAFVDPYRREVTRMSALESENIREEFGCLRLVARRHDRSVMVVGILS